MQATLIFNGDSGGAGKVDPDKLQQMLREVGYLPVYRATADEADLDEVLKTVEGLVVVAGGDGSVRAVATRLIGREVPIAIVPMGTANNIARTLGVEGTPQEVVAGLREREVRRIDVGRVEAPWGTEYFLEGAGLGLYADLLADYDPEEGKSVLRAVGTVRDVLIDYQPQHCQVTVDGERLSGYLVALEVLNTKAIGPRLQLAPDADPSDGLFDVVCVFDGEDVNLFDYAAGLLNGKFDELDNVRKQRAKRVELAWRGSPLHLDAEVRPSGARAEDGDAARLPVPDGDERTVTFDVLEHALELWLPRK